MGILKTENEDQKQILGQYEERFVQIKKHIEQLNADKQSQFDDLSQVNSQLQQNLERIVQENQALKTDKQQMNQKLRDLEWNKD